MAHIKKDRARKALVLNGLAYTFDSWTNRENPGAAPIDAGEPLYCLAVQTPHDVDPRQDTYSVMLTEPEMLATVAAWITRLNQFHAHKRKKAENDARITAARLATSP